MKNLFFTWDNFIEGFDKEAYLSNDVFENMIKSGLKNNCLIKMDFTFICDKKSKLQKLEKFLRVHYQYTIKEIKKYGNLWEINGETNEIPMTADNLLYWVLDMYKRGYEFDTKFDAYGGLLDSKNLKFPIINKTMLVSYFNEGIDSYNNGNLSGAIFYWNLVIEIDPKDPNTYYSRATVKHELYDYKYALKDYDKAIEIAPDFAAALINRGTLKDENGDYQEAIIDYESVLKINNLEKEEKQKAYFNLGNTHFNLKNEQKACENWNKAFENGAEYAKDRIDEYHKH